jgi:hypothetical protein
MQQSVNITKEWAKFIIIMLVFMAGMIYLTIQGVHNPWFWLVYAAVWWIAEARIAKNIHLHWSIWVVLILVLTFLDLWIIQTFAH